MNLCNSATGAQSSISLLLKHCRVLVFCWCLLVVFCILSAKPLTVPPCYDVRFTRVVFSNPVEIEINFMFSCSQAVMRLHLLWNHSEIFQRSPGKCKCLPEPHCLLIFVSCKSCSVATCVISLYSQGKIMVLHVTHSGCCVKKQTTKTQHKHMENLF